MTLFTNIMLMIKEALITSIFCFLLYGMASAGQGGFSPQAEAVYTAYSTLNTNCRNKVYQDKYLSVFPKNSREFMKIFQPKDFDELYDGHNYIYILENIINDQPGKVIPVLLTIAKDVPHESDAPEYLDNVIIYACSKKPDVFIKYIKTFEVNDRRKIISLLADHEAIQWAKDYQECIDILKARKARDLARIFEEERTLRMKQPHCK